MLSEFFITLNFALGVTGPIFILVLLGICLKALRVVDSGLLDGASKLVFLVSLPALLFLSVANADIRSTFNGELVGVGIVGSLIIFIGSTLAARWLVENPRDRGVFVQGAFRGNLAIVGLAFCYLAYGEEGIARASIFMAALTLVYNFLAVITLSASLGNSGSKLVGVAIQVFKNPLMIAIALGILVSALRLKVPPILDSSLQTLANMTLPLALICIGGTISIAEFKNSSTASMVAVLIKLIITPVVLVFLAYLVGIEKLDLGVLFLMISAPSAAAGYVMVQGMGGNGRLAANIVVISTLASVVTVSAGLVILKMLSLI